MRLVKWIGGTLLVFVVAGFLLAAWRVAGALPAPPAPLAHGALTFADGVSGDYALEGLTVTLGGPHGLVVAQGGRTVFQGPKSSAFFWIGDGTLTYRGMGDTFLPAMDVQQQCADMEVTAVARRAYGLTLDLTFACPDGAFPLKLDIRNGEGGVEFIARSVMRLEHPKEVADYRTYDAGAPHFWALIGDNAAHAPVFGGGEQFSRAALNGQFLPLISAEQGVARGDQPLTSLVNALLPGITGDWYSTYAPAGVFTTAHQTFYFGRAWCDRAEGVGCNRFGYGADEASAPDYDFRALDLRDADRIALMGRGNGLSVTVTARSASPLPLMGPVRENIMRPLPGWIGEGAVLGIQGGTDVVRAKVKAAQEAGVPVVGVWLQDWQGQRWIDASERLWWNWVLDRARYPAWEELVADLKADGIQVMTYINPYLVDVGDELPNRRNLYAEAKAQGYLLKDPDGSIHHAVSGTIVAGVVDLYNEDAATWIAGIITDNMIGTGSMGFMADFAESFPMREGVRKHNQYPVLWAKTVRQAIDAAPQGDQIVAFHRSGHTDSPRHATAFWAGDQLVTWGAHDGFKSAITAMMTGGISGMAYNHSDIGGYTTVVTPLTNIRRSKELFQRWADFAAFTPIFRTHEGNQPLENHQFDSDAETLQHFGKMAHLFKCLHPYRQRLMAEHSQTGAPLMRHPWLHYPEDERFHPMTYQQMMLGADIMVVPVSDPGKESVSAYLPDGGWEHFWTGESYDAGDHEVAAPIGQPAFFVRPDSAVKRELAACAL